MLLWVGTAPAGHDRVGEGAEQGDELLGTAITDGSHDRSSQSIGAVLDCLPELGARHGDSHLVIDQPSCRQRRRCRRPLVGRPAAVGPSTYRWVDTRAVPLGNVLKRATDGLRSSGCVEALG